ncbi:nucleotidyltransferase family protein [Thioclava sp. BHET1]|nr:nucleotidyltransferase family protein [Thioclava sp. BHET1]
MRSKRGAPLIGRRTYSAYGLGDLFNGIVRANKRLVTREIYDAKVAKWIARWASLSVMPWDEA